MGTTIDSAARMYALTDAQRLAVQAETGPWQRQALCGGTLTFLQLGAVGRDMVCSKCPVRDECETFGLYRLEHHTPQRRGTKTAFPCSHPRTPENTVANGHRANGEPILACRKCRQRRAQRLQSKHKGAGTTG